MAIPICIKLPAMPPEYKLALPGMGELTYIRDSLERMPRPSEMLLKFLNSIGPALAPVYMLIKVLDVIQAIIRCVLAVKKAITELSPLPLIQCFEGLFEAIAKLIPLIPPMAYLKMVMDIIGLVRYLLDDIIGLVYIIDNEISQIKAMINAGTASGDLRLIEIAECSRHNLNQQAAGMINVLTLIGKLLGTLLIVLDMLEAFLPPPAAKEIRKVKEAITGASDTALSSSVGSFPGLQQMLEAVTMLRDALVTIQTVIGPVVGVNLAGFLTEQVEQALQNP